MKRIPEKRALERLQELKDNFAARISSEYEHAAKSCATCETKGACCLDAHFVNVRITRIEARAIANVLERLPDEDAGRVRARIEKAVERYALTDDGDPDRQTYACPLFEKDAGCLVHREGKPAACIHHACYENERDLPPDSLLEEQETMIERLDERVYGTRSRWMPLPVWLSKMR